MKTAQHYSMLRELYDAEAKLNYVLAVFGDHIAEREGFTDVDGVEAIHLYLVTKHHWLPSQVRAMSLEDLRFVLAVEMQGWTLPTEACG